MFHQETIWFLRHWCHHYCLLQMLVDCFLLLVLHHHHFPHMKALGLVYRRPCQKIKTVFIKILHCEYSFALFQLKLVRKYFLYLIWVVDETFYSSCKYFHCNWNLFNEMFKTGVKTYTWKKCNSQNACFSFSGFKALSCIWWSLILCINDTKNMWKNL